MPDRTCSIEDCTRPHAAHGLCPKHYQRWYKYGDPLTIVAPKSSTYEPPPCTVTGCDRTARAQGLCHTHYMQVTRGRLPSPISERPRGTQAEIWERHTQRGAPDDCWEWQGARLPSGYGLMGVRRPEGGWVNGYAHRVSYELHHGPIPDGMYVLHSCDNPPCVNPAHLRVGTAAENMADALSRGRHYSQRHASDHAENQERE